MRITFLGTSDGYPEKERYCSCTVVTVGGKHYVIDAGVSLVSAMLKNDLDPACAAGVFITHMHGDHTNGLIEYVNIAIWGNRYRPTGPVYVPTKEGADALMNLARAMDHQKYEVSMHVFAEGLVFADENIRLTAFRNEHTPASFGFLLEAEGKKVFFTGDMNHEITDCPEFVYHEHTDLIICECAHNCLPELTDKLNAMQTDRFLINHVAKNHSEEEFYQAKPRIHVPFDLAFDGMIVDL